MLDENETRRAVAWLHFLEARFCCERGLEALALRHLEWARRVAPLDRQLEALSRRCQPLQ
jgi:hypothetical protein